MAQMSGFNARAWRELQHNHQRAAHKSSSRDIRRSLVAESSASPVSTSSEAPGYSEELEDHFRKPNEWEYEKDMATAENRSESLETLAIVAALLAGFAANDASSFDANAAAWSSPRIELYAFLLFFSFAGNLFVSVSGALTVMACKRVHSWDVKLMKKTPEKIYEGQDYINTMRLLYGEDEELWFHKSRKETNVQGVSEKVEELVLKIPLNYWVFKNMCEGTFALTGFGVTLFPYNVACYLAASALNFSKGAGWFIQVLTFTLITPWIFLTFYSVHKMVKLFMM